MGLAAHRSRHQDAAIRAARRDRRARDHDRREPFSYGLDALCAWRGLPGKDEALLQEAVEAAGFKINKKNPLQSYIWRLPAHLVGPYAEADAANTLALFENLEPDPRQEGTRAAYRLEVDLLPMVLEMRRRGIRIDQGAAEQARDYCLQKRDAALAELSEQLGSLVGMDEIASQMEGANLRRPSASIIRARRKASRRSRPANRVDGHASALAAAADRDREQVRRTPAAHFSKATSSGTSDRRAHLRRDPSAPLGRRRHGSFRFSYSNPPLQQMPSRDKELGPLIRSVFLPEEGEIWCKPDVSQQEFRFLVHHAVLRNLPGAKEAAEHTATIPTPTFTPWSPR